MPRCFVLLSLYPVLDMKNATNNLSVRLQIEIFFNPHIRYIIMYYNDDGGKYNDYNNYFNSCQRFPKLDGVDPALSYRRAQALLR